MSKKIPKTNPTLIQLINELKTKSRIEDVSIWRVIAKRFERPTRKFAEVNISKINRYASDNDTVIVPGKVLSAGNIDHSVTVAAFNFSINAEDKIHKAGGTCLSIAELVETNPKGSNIRIME